MTEPQDTPEQPTPEQPTTEVEGTKAAAARSRRPQLIAAVLLAAAAILLWAASQMTWATVIVADDLSEPRTLEVKGSDWSPWLTAVAIALLAAIAALFALRGWLLRVVAVLVAVFGVVSFMPGILLLTAAEDDDFAATTIDFADRYAVVAVQNQSGPGLVVIAGAVCAVLAAVMMMRAATTAGMSSKYVSPAARRDELERRVFAEREQRLAAEAQARAAGADPAQKAAAPADDEPTVENERLMWDALDTGMDPTDRD